MCWLSLADYYRERKHYPVVTFRSYGMGKFKGANPWMRDREIDAFAASHRPGTYVIMEAPNEGLDGRYGLHGELGWYNGGWCLYYTLKLGYMRKMLALHGKHALGWRAQELIRKHASPSGYDMIMELFEKFSDAPFDYPVIEFAILPRSVGRYKMDTLIWEIRNNGY